MSLILEALGPSNAYKKIYVVFFLFDTALYVFQDIRVLVEVVDSVTSDTGGLNGWEEDDEDDDEKLKRIIKEKLSYGCNVLCVWDCSRFWIRISEVLSFIVFDAFTEVFITLCILVNVIFMALDHYFIEYDPLGCEKNCGM